MGNDMMEAYLFEMNTLLEQVDEIVLSAEKNGSFSEDEVNEIFRIMHTFKGSSAMMEFNSLMTVAHRVEDLFFIIREKSMDVIPESLRPDLFDLIFQAIDFFRGEVEKIENGQPTTNDIDNFLEKVNGFQSKIEAGGEDAPAAEEELSGGAVLLDFGSAEYPYALQVFFDEGCGMENLRAFMLVNSVREAGVTAFDYMPADVDTNRSAPIRILISSRRRHRLRPRRSLLRRSPSWQCPKQPRKLRKRLPSQRLHSSRLPARMASSRHSTPRKALSASALASWMRSRRLWAKLLLPSRWSPHPPTCADSSSTTLQALRASCVR